MTNVAGKVAGVTGAGTGIGRATALLFAKNGARGHHRYQLEEPMLRRPVEPKQYTSAEFRRLLADAGGIQSLSRKGQCWDNAVGESWFATLKTELIYRQSWATRTQVRRAVFEFVEVFYNRQRLHSSLSYLTPVEYEQTVTHHHKAAQAA